MENSTQNKEQELIEADSELKQTLFEFKKLFKAVSGEELSVSKDQLKDSKSCQILHASKFDFFACSSFRDDGCVEYI